MQSLSEKDRANLEAILDSTKKIVKYTVKFKNADEFYDHEVSFDAVLMNFVIIGESVAKLSKELRLRAKHIPWTKIKRFRNIIAHNYFGVDAEEVWQIIQLQLPNLKVQILEILIPK
jgi:uncharacterized protein with HEPN domain